MIKFKFIEFTITMAIVVMLVILFRHLGKKKIKVKYFLFIWQLIILRLLIPISIENHISLLPISMPFFQENEEINSSKQAIERDSEDNTDKVISLKEDEEGVLEHSEGIQVIRRVEQCMKKYGMMIWLGGSVICLVIFSYFSWRCKRILREAMLIREDAIPVEWWQIPKRTVFIYVSDRIATPITVGTIKPKIILPKHIQCSQEELINILTHEYIHIRDKHVFWKRLAMIATCLHWFNPLVWTMQRLFNKDTELACDEQVLELLGNEKRESYALSLIRFAERKGELGGLQSAFSKNDLEERIVSIMNYKKKSIGTSVIIIGACFASVSLSATTLFSDTASVQRNQISMSQSIDANEPSIKQLKAKVNIKQQNEKMETDKKEKEKNWTKEYVQYGVTYDEKTDTWYYKGKVVVYFLDIVDKTKPSYRLEVAKGEGYKIMAVRNEEGKLIGVEEIDVDMNEPFKILMDMDLFDGEDTNYEEDEYEEDYNCEDDDDYGYEDDDMGFSITDMRTEAQLKEYEKHGLTYADDSYYYKGKKVLFFSDNESHYFSTNPSGTYSLIAIRDKEQKLIGFKELSKKELKKLLDTDMYRGIHIDGIN